MKKIHFIGKQVLVLVFILCCNKNSFAQSAEQPVVDLQKAKMIVSSIIKHFAEYYLMGDSVAVDRPGVSAIADAGVDVDQELLSTGGRRPYGLPCRRRRAPPRHHRYRSMENSL